MTMPEMQKAISRPRFLLAAIKDKQKDLESLSRQFRRQLDPSDNNSIHGDNPLDVTLGIMEEIRERLDNVEKTREHLAAINMRAQDELQALELTDKIEHAKAELATLRADQGPDEQEQKSWGDSSRKPASGQGRLSQANSILRWPSQAKSLNQPVLHRGGLELGNRTAPEGPRPPPTRFR